VDPERCQPVMTRLAWVTAWALIWVVSVTVCEPARNAGRARGYVVVGYGHLVALPQERPHRGLDRDGELGGAAHAGEINTDVYWGGHAGDRGGRCPGADRSPPGMVARWQRGLPGSPVPCYLFGV